MTGRVQPLVEGKMYVVYWGPSELGKSIAVTHHPDLQGRQGVIYLSLQEATSEAVLTRLTNALTFQLTTKKAQSR